MKTALLLSTYPIKKPYHGGQHRVSKLKKAYERIGYKVSSVAFYDPNSFRKDEVGYLDVPIESQVNTIPFIDDFLVSERMLSNNLITNRLSQSVDRIKPTLIHVEQPWLFPVVQWLKKRNPSLRIVFGSENIEYDLKSKILSQYKFDIAQPKIHSIIEKIRKLEILAADESEVTLCVSDDDRKWFTQNSNQRNILVVANGVSPTVCNSDDVRQLKKKYKLGKYFLFVASAHPPNIEGFKNLVGDALGCLPLDVKLVIAGSISEHITPYLTNSRYKFLNESRLVSLGKVEQKVLDTAICGSFAIVLPITTGGGTNLKTAEAIYSGKHVVASKTSMRGFDKYLSLPGIHLADNKDEFRRKLAKVSQLAPLVRTKDEEVLTRGVTWTETTKPLINYLRSTDRK